jgi:hypothetical protein
MEVKIHYKVELAKRGKKIKGLSQELNMDYGRVSKILNGFTEEPFDFHRQVKTVLEKWDRNEPVQRF